jgi:hypothetical protein
MLTLKVAVQNMNSKVELKETDIVLLSFRPSLCASIENSRLDIKALLLSAYSFECEEER